MSPIRMLSRRRHVPAWKKLGFIGLGTASSLLFSSGAVAQQLDPDPSFRNVRDPAQVPTARYARGEDVDLALIIGEWRDRFPQTPIFACACLEETCGSSAVWPFRQYTRYQPFIALGPTNALTNEIRGFNCFDIDTGEDPQ